MSRGRRFASCILALLAMACGSSEGGSGSAASTTGSAGTAGSGGSGNGGSSDAGAGGATGGAGGAGAMDAGEICPAEIPVSGSPCSIDELHCLYCAGPPTDGGCSFSLDVVCLGGQWRVPR